MKTTVYAVNMGGAWRWHVSLDLWVDRRFWMERRGMVVEGELGLLWLEPALSFGQAFVLQKRWNRLDWTGCSGTDVMRKIGSMGASSGLPGEIAFRLTWNKWRWDGKESLNPSLLLSGFGDGELVDERELARLLRLLQGKSLLPEEMEALLKDQGLSQVASSWRKYVQYAYLLGKLDWVNGVSEEESGMQVRSLAKLVSNGSGLWGLVVRVAKLWPAKQVHRCRRCGSDRLNWTECSSCGGKCPYCENCLTMGRVRFCSMLLQADDRGEEQVREVGMWRSDTPLDTDRPSVAMPDHVLERSLVRWGLSPAQEAASRAGLQFLSMPVRRRTPEEAACFLIWAVTGAGKTEMIFPLIDYELAKGGSVCIATPRRDVVLELKPRIEKAFSEASVVTLYGGSEQKWAQGNVTIATTHQLLRFWRKFDLIVIDEIDAFPFHNNPMLEFAVRKACKRNGRYVFLSATPPKHLQQAVHTGRLPHVKVPVRYHRHPLPVPKLVNMKPLQKWVNGRALPGMLRKRLASSLDRGAQLFVFAPAIYLVEPLVAQIRRAFPDISVAGTSSKDPERAEKVQRFRERVIRLLVTTTILERGVTVPKSDVFILDAGSTLFDEAALVQMAGRAGRSKDDPAGRVVFAAPDKTKSQVNAIRQIQSMNRLARRKGFLANGR